MEIISRSESNLSEQTKRDWGVLKQRQVETVTFFRGQDANI